MDLEEQILDMANNLKQCGPLLDAIGDPTRQHLIMGMLSVGNRNGIRVNEITKSTDLSRPAVSHHLKILKQAGVVKMRKEGTKNYYYFDPDNDKFNQLINTLTNVVKIAKQLPDRTGE